MDPKERIEQWFLRYSDDVYHFLVYYLRTSDVEDLVQLQHLHTPDKTPEEVLQLNEEAARLYQAINRLRQSYRDVLLLRGIKGLAETADILNWSESKVTVTLHRVLKALQRQWEQEAGEVTNDAV